jgi:sirohydrochlorin cobaltochelatase
MHHGLILFGHGARDARWSEPFEAVAARVRSLQPGVDVRLAYLEFMNPSLPEAGQALADAGCTHVAVQPMFLGTGGHVRRDLPALVDALRVRHPGVEWTLHTAIGETGAVMDAMARVAASTVGTP